MWDTKVLDHFLARQGRLFSRPVASDRQEAEEFLDEVMAQVFENEKDLRAYFAEVGLDVEGDLLEAAEVFALEDGRFLVVEG